MYSPSLVSATGLSLNHSDLQALHQQRASNPVPTILVTAVRVVTPWFSCSSVSRQPGTVEPDRMLSGPVLPLTGSMTLEKSLRSLFPDL